MLKAGTCVKYEYEVPFLGLIRRGTGYIINNEVIIGDDPGYAVSIAHMGHNDVAYLRPRDVTEVTQ